MRKPKQTAPDPELDDGMEAEPEDIDPEDPQEGETMEDYEARRDREERKAGKDEGTDESSWLESWDPNLGFD